MCGPLNLDLCNSLSPSLMASGTANVVITFRFMMAAAADTDTDAADCGMVCNVSAVCRRCPFFVICTSSSRMRIYDI